MKIIYFFVKFFNEEQYANDFIRGKIYANILSYFKKIEEKESATRNDRHEGVVGWFQPGRGRLVLNEIDFTPDLAGPIEMQKNWLNHLYVFCIYAAHSGGLDLDSLSSGNLDPLRKQLEIPEACLKLGKYAVVVKDVPEFIRRIENVTKSKGYRGCHGLVEYYDPEIFHGSFTDREAVFKKRDEYSHQREYRFVFEPLILGTDHIELDIGDISDIAIRFYSADINKELLGGSIEFGR